MFTTKIASNVKVVKTTFFVHTRQYFWFNGEFLQNKYFQHFDRSKTRHDRAKIGLAGQHDRPPLKNYFEPWAEKALFDIVLCEAPRGGLISV